MRASDYGPVSVSRLKAEQRRIFDALEQGRRVLVAHRGVVVAVIDPTPALPRQVLEMYAMPQIDTTPYEWTATAINQSRPAPSHWLTRAKEGQPSLVTRGGKLFGALRSMSPDEAAGVGDGVAGVARRDREIDRFLDERPDASADELAEFTASLDSDSDSDSDSVAGDHVPYVVELLGDAATANGRYVAAVDAMYRAMFAASDDLVKSDLRGFVDRKSVN